MTSSCVHTFNAYESELMMDTALQLAKEKIFEGIGELELGNLPDWMQFAEQSMKCYKLEESKSEDMEPCKVHIPEIEGEIAVVGLEISHSFYEPLKMVKVNIGIEEVPKFASIGDYWDEKIVCKITELLHEYQDLFPTNFIEMKGIAGELGEMTISLKPDAKPVRQRLY